MSKSMKKIRQWICAEMKNRTMCYLPSTYRAVNTNILCIVTQILLPEELLMYRLLAVNPTLFQSISWASCCLNMLCDKRTDYIEVKLKEGNVFFRIRSRGMNFNDTLGINLSWLFVLLSEKCSYGMTMAFIWCIRMQDPRVATDTVRGSQVFCQNQNRFVRSKKQA